MGLTFWAVRVRRARSGLAWRAGVAEWVSNNAGRLRRLRLCRCVGYPGLCSRGVGCRKLGGTEHSKG